MSDEPTIELDALEPDIEPEPGLGDPPAEPELEADQ